MNDTESKLVGAKIKFLRNKMNITIEELAYRTGIDYSYLAKMEKGKVNFTIKKLIQLSKIFDIELKELFNFDNMKDRARCIYEIKELIDKMDDNDLYELHSALMKKYKDKASET